MYYIYICIYMLLAVYMVTKMIIEHIINMMYVVYIQM